MRITFLLPAANLSGGVRAAVTYARQLMERGHEVVVVYPRRERESLMKRLRGVLERLPREVADGSHLDGSGVPMRVVNRPITAADLPDADAVIATWHHCAEWMSRLPSSKGAPVHFIQGDDRDSLRFDPRLVESVEAIWRLSMPKVVVSRWVADRVRGVSPEAQVDIIPNGVDLEQFNSMPREKQNPPRVGFVYSTAPCKGTDIAIAAVHETRRQLDGLDVTTFGAAPPTDAFRLPADTEFVLRPEQDHLRGLYGKCDAWLFASRAEGFGLPILEAMACRTPVIAAPAGAAPELLADGGGILVDAESPASMAAGIVQIARMSAAEWAAMSMRAYLTARRCTWQRATDALEVVLNQAVRSPKQSLRDVVLCTQH